MVDLRLLVLVVEAGTASSVVVDGELVAAAVYLGDHLILLGGLLHASAAADGAARLVTLVCGGPWLLVR